MTTPTAPYNDSIQETVARETARRKRVFLAFMALLLVPIAIGAYALAKAPSDTEKVVQDVTPIVTERVGGQIATRVKDDVVKQTEPLIRDNVSRAISTSIEPRIATATSALRQDITNLQATAQKTSEFVAGVRNDQEGLRHENTSSRQQINDLRQTMARELESIRSLVNTSVQTANANREAIGGLARRISVVETELKRLQERVKASEADKATRTPR